MSSNVTHPDTKQTAARIILYGLVQGVGMRPAVARLAKQLQLTGFVRNNSNGVEVHVQGDASHVDAFFRQLPAGIFVNAMRSNVKFRENCDTFAILESDIATSAVSTSIPVDTALCDCCRDEILDSANRRYGYSLTACTDCGPRYSLTHAMPFDRAATTMRHFDQCPTCSSEYESPDDRRFHAQTNACPDCGPDVMFSDTTSNANSEGFSAIRAVAAAVRSGRVLALKGIGGYQLICDATSSVAVQRLRERKRRVRKPLAVMVLSTGDAEQLAALSAVERTTLAARSNPIVVVSCREDSTLASGIHPGLNCVGLMLPSTPLHLLLMKEVGRPCVVTSGNLDGEPLAYSDDDRNRLQKVADVLLNHNREIIRPIDDSVVRCSANQPLTIRAARGIAPLRLNVRTTQQILAVGGQQKVALALSNGQQPVLGPHIGDLNSVAARKRFVEQVQQLTQLYGTQPSVIAHDMHLDFFTTQWAGEQQVKTIAVQHHHAHIAAGMVEHGWLDREVLGIAFDGTGYGTDSTIWGGEFLLCTSTSFRRIARFRPFALPGGEKSVREPWRIALSLILAATDAKTAATVLHTHDDDKAFRLLSQMLARNGSSTAFPVTSSVGRLFDGVAALLLNITESAYEGEPAMMLESVCDQTAIGEYKWPVTDGDIMEIDWRPMIREILTDIQNGVSAGIIATRFIRSLARVIADVCSQFSDPPIVLTGGCFQNRFLTEETARMLQSHPQPVGLPGRIPCNDGGLAVGQLAVAAAQLNDFRNGGR